MSLTGDRMRDVLDRADNGAPERLARVPDRTHPGRIDQSRRRIIRVGVCAHVGLYPTIRQRVEREESPGRGVVLAGTQVVQPGRVTVLAGESERVRGGLAVVLGF